MRKAVQFQVLPPDAEGASSLVVLADDGVLFELSKSDANDEGEWRELPALPQDEEPVDGEGE